MMNEDYSYYDHQEGIPVSKHYTRKQRRRDDRIILVIYGLIIVAFLSVIFSAWWTVFRTTRYYNIPYPVSSPAYSEC